MNEDGLMQKIKEWFFSFTIVTRSTGFVCVFVYICGLIFGTFEMNTCLSYDSIMYDYQIWRLFTSAFVHNGFFHLLFNMMTLQGMGPFVERNLGSFKMGYLIFLSIFLGGILQLILEKIGMLMEIVTTNNCSLGFSGVLFALIVVECKDSSDQSKSLFYGMFKVPTAVYPPILLIVIQLFFPGISFVGHLSGLIVGYLWIYGFLKFLTPSSQRIEGWENGVLQFFSRTNGYISNNGESNPYLETNSWPTLFPSFSKRPPFVPFQGEGNLLTNTSSSYSSKAVVNSNYEGTQVQMPSGDIERFLDNEDKKQKGDHHFNLDSVVVDSNNNDHHNNFDYNQNNNINHLVNTSSLSSSPSDLGNNSLLEFSRTLISMGFTREQSLMALSKANGDINVALDLLRN